MKLPYKPTSLEHRHGGKILEIVEIKHQADKPRDGHSTDSWYFIGRVQWDDGSGDPTKLSPIDMLCICADSPEGHDEINTLSTLMMDYLNEHGEWCEKGSHKGWYAHRKVRSAA